MFSEPKIAKKGLILVTVPLLFELAFVSVLAVLLFQTELEVEKEAEARRINRQTTIVSQHMLDFMIGAAAFSLVKNDAFDSHLNKAVKELPTAMDDLIEMLKDKPHKQKIAIKIKKSFREGVELGDKARKRFQDGSKQEAMLLVPELKRLSKESSIRLHDLSEDERQVELKSPIVQRQLRQSFHLCLIVGVLFNVAICLALANYFSRSIVHRLETMIANSARLTIGKELLPQVHGTDEIAILDRSFHDMARELTLATKRERALVSNAKEIICSISADERLVSANNAAENSWGYKPEELIGKRLSMVIGHDNLTPFNEILENSPDKETSFERELTIKRKDGSEGEFVWSVQWSPEEEEFFCVVYDITERKQQETLIRLAEEKFRAILENIPTGLAMCSPHGIVEMTNPALLDMFGIDQKANFLIGKSLSTLFKPQSSPEENKTESEVLEFIPQDLVGILVKCQAQNTSGQLFPVELTCHHTETNQGKRYIVLIIDVSDKEEIERLKQEFIMILSHELRSPLTSLRLLLTLLQEGAYGELNQKGQTKLDNAEKNIGRLVRLIQELLDFESLESDKLHVEKNELVVSELVDKAVDASVGPASNKGIEITVDTVETKLLGDEDRLSQVIVNLLSNAIKYSPEGETIAVTASKVASFVEVKITDNGPGIAEKHRKMIFERFKQVYPNDKTGKGNVGLGLAISKAIIEKHGGSIGVDSVEGKGSTFWFKIPSL